MLDKRDNKVKAKAFTSTKSEKLQLYSPNTCPLRLGSNSFYWGLALIISGSGSFIAFLYGAILSKILPPSGIPLLSAIENDSCRRNHLYLRWLFVYLQWLLLCSLAERYPYSVMLIIEESSTSIGESPFGEVKSLSSQEWTVMNLKSHTGSHEESNIWNMKSVL